MFHRPDPGSPVPIYVQLMDQVRHAVETGVLSGGEQLPALRDVAVRLVVNVNTVSKAYHDLAADGVVEIIHGAGIFVVPRERWPVSLPHRRAADALMKETVTKLRTLGLQTDEIRRMAEAALGDSRSDRASSRKRRA
jgi:GntR family transcriptional regulator